MKMKNELVMDLQVTSCMYVCMSALERLVTAFLPEH